MCCLFVAANFSTASFGPEIQRAEVNCEGSNRTGRPYSCSIRLASTSNCSAPTTPTMKPDPICGLNTLAAPSSANCISAFSRCLAFIGSPARTVCRSSGAKDGMPVKRSISPSVSASPMRSWPWLGMPMMSPAHASSASSRSDARNSTGFDTAIGFFDRTCVIFIPRSKCPEARRTNATRSRCLGSMLACTLKTKPVTSLSSGEICRSAAVCGCGWGPYSPMPVISSLTPKLLMAEPNQIGVMCPSRNDLRSKAGSNSRAISTSSRSFANCSAGMCSASFGSSRPEILTDPATRLRSARSISSSRSCSRS